MILEYRGLTIRPVTQNSLSMYIELFKASFPSYKTSIDYVSWLYFENPNGSAVGFDAYDGDLLIAHYVCIPIWIDGYQKPSLLALNTATHPKYQGRGLLKVLANNTYENYGDDFSCVVGVANAQAIKPLTKHLGFEHIGDLELRFGRLDSSTFGRRTYSADEVHWRAICPKKALQTHFYPDQKVEFTRHMYGVFPISALCPIRGEKPQIPNSMKSVKKFRVTLDWRRNKKPFLFLPKRLKPSPLSFVFRPLSESDSSRLAAWTFPDFDAL
jgi:hypothetical protein